MNGNKEVGKLECYHIRNLHFGCLSTYIGVSHELFCKQFDVPFGNHVNTIQQGSTVIERCCV